MKALRKACIRLAGATMTSVEFYMKMPIRDFLELYEEVAEEQKEMNEKSKKRR